MIRKFIGTLLGILVGGSLIFMIAEFGVYKMAADWIKGFRTTPTTDVTTEVTTTEATK